MGVLFSSTCKWPQAQSTLAHQALKAEFSLQRMLYHFNDVKPDFICQLFDKLITPILMYASEVWGFHTAAAIERVQTGFCKRILHLKKSTSNNLIYGELNRLPLRLERYNRIIRYWLKIVVIKQNPVVCKMYNNFYMDVENGADGYNDNWVVLVRDLICQLGFADVWLAQGVGNIHFFLKLCKQRIRD